MPKYTHLLRTTIAAATLTFTSVTAVIAQNITEFPVPTTGRSGPTGITAGPDGNVWFTDASNSTITGSTVTQFPIGVITPAGQISEFMFRGPTFLSPSGIVAGPDGALWFTSGNGLANAIGRITTAGSISTFPIPTHNSNPLNITVGSDGALWFTESGVGKIGRITTGGTITEFPTLQTGSQPKGIAAGPDGALWVADPGAQVVGRVTTAEAVTTFRGNSTFFPTSIAAGSDGALWVGEVNVIERVTISGQITTFPLASQNMSGSPIQGVVAGPDGPLWFTDTGSNKIGRITTAGTITEFPIPNSNSFAKSNHRRPGREFVVH
jgi:streptogramin lyase